LQSRLNVLTGGGRDLPRRQQTIRNAIDWSYELLDDAERVFFARLGVFLGGWTIEAAEAVCGNGLTLNVLGGLESLLDKSLLRQFDGVSGETRFTMLETIREYAFEKLTQSGELLTIQQAHANVINALLEKVNTAMNGPDETSWFEKLDDELENLRAAVTWALAHEQPGLVFKGGGLFDYWFRRRSNYYEPLGWLERALATPVSVPNYVPSERAWALNITGILKFQTDEIQSAVSYFESSLTLFREIGDRGGISECLKNMGEVEEFAQKNFEKARQLYEQSLAVVEVETFYTTITLNNLGRLEQMRGNWQAARDYYLRSREICERLGSEAGVSYTDIFLGRLAIEQQEIIQGKGYFESALKSNWVQNNPLYKGFLCGVLGYLYILLDNKNDAQRRLSQALEAAVESLNQGLTLLLSCFIFEGKAYLELSDGQVEHAALFFGVAQTQRENDNYPLTEFELPLYKAAIAQARSAIGDAAFEAAFAKGQAMTLEESIQFALEVI
jgi:tetratricopeptide (TPR) repeat protein